MFRHPSWQIALTAILTTFAGEFKIVPFIGEGFRFGLGASIFFLLLLMGRPIHYIRTGFITGMTVLGYRMFKDLLLNGDHFSMLLSFKAQAPAFLFYFLFAIGLWAIQVEKYRFAPLRLGAHVTAIDFLVNSIEHVSRILLLSSSRLDPIDFAYLIGVAALRSYFVVGIYSSISLNQFRAVHIEQKKRLEQMMKVSSGLYAETLYLNKSMENIEEITAQSYDLYRKLKEQELSVLGRQALAIAQQIHEVKKDSQRILAGLLKLYDKETAAELSLSEIIQYVVESNQKYSSMIHREILFETDVKMDYKTKSYIPLLTVIGNLVANAVEAIDPETKGTVKIRLEDERDETVFTIYDNGKGIAAEDLIVIFEPGYTTKFNQDGVASTGIGLSHVHDIVHSLQGSIHAGSERQETWFEVRIPTKQLKVEDEDGVVLLYR
ncbi:MAG TPA: ATP-binding protein [Bacillota bacterium]|nr:ATP-binding protein [Bacillota bacterium]